MNNTSINKHQIQNQKFTIFSKPFKKKENYNVQWSVHFLQKQNHLYWRAGFWSRSLSNGQFNELSP